MRPNEMASYAAGSMASTAAPPQPAMARLWSDIERLDTIAAKLDEFTLRLAGSYPSKDSAVQIKAAPNGAIEEMHERLSRLVEFMGGNVDRLHAVL